MAHSDKMNVQASYMCVKDQFFCNHLYSLEMNPDKEMKITIIVKTQKLREGIDLLVGKINSTLGIIHLMNSTSRSRLLNIKRGSVGG